MRYLLFWPFLVINSSQAENNDSDIITKYSGHSEVEMPRHKETPIEKEKVPVDGTVKTDVPELEAVTEDVVFIPNDKPVFRNTMDGVKVADVIQASRVDDVVRGRIVSETEAPKDVLFITGKNNDDTELNIKQKDTPKTKQKSESKPTKRIDCTNLDCNNTRNAICGGKIESSQWKYRLFLNECYFRKVNCAFQYEVNRYNEVPMAHCKNIGAHYSKPREVKGIMPQVIPEVPQRFTKINETRRVLSSRRSLTLGVDGSYCDHICPVSCTNEYDPQCAVSNVGHRKVFLNHCKLDENSCLHNIVWHRRPLSECVGGRKADANQNRGFISWMQRVGIVDRKGRLVLN